MRSSKNRSRNKSNRNRSVGNVVNRVFDSSGPEGKVRGTPQQIIEKYNQLARDAQLSNDRVAAENFQQHAEHYVRLLAQATKEQDAQREQQEREQQARRERQDAERQRRRDQQETASGSDDQPDVVMDNTEDTSSESTLVETPEDAPKEPPAKPKRARKPRKPKEEPATSDSTESSGDTPSDGNTSAAAE